MNSTAKVLSVITFASSLALSACSSGTRVVTGGVAPTGSGVAPTGSGVAQSGSGVTTAIRTLDRGLATGSTSSATTLVIDDELEWAALWEEHQQLQATAAPRPQVDFSLERVLAVFGTPGALSVEITTVSADPSGALTVAYVEEPGRTATTRPYHVVAVDDTSSPISFQQTPVSGVLEIQPPANLTFGVYAPHTERKLSVLGGTGPYTWTVASGDISLPPGISFQATADSEAVLVGSAIKEGSYMVTVEVEDSANNSGSALMTLSAMPLQIATLAGSTFGFGGDGGVPAAAGFTSPLGMALAPTGGVYVADAGSRVRLLDFAANGTVQTVAGTGVLGLMGDGGLATAAQIYNTTHVAVDRSGALFIADSWNHRVRRVDPVTGLISTYAGTTFGFSGDGGAATAAQLQYPWTIAIDLNGDLLIGDYDNHRVRKVEALTGLISTVVGSGVAGALGDGGDATLAQLTYPRGIAIDPLAGHTYVLETFAGRVRKVDYNTRIITLVAGNGLPVIPGVTGDGALATDVSLDRPSSVAVDTGGNVFLLETTRLRRIDAVTGRIVTVAGNGTGGFAGDGGPALAAAINPRAIMIHLSGAILITTGDSTSEARLRVITATPVTPLQ